MEPRESEPPLEESLGRLRSRAGSLGSADTKIAGLNLWRREEAVIQGALGEMDTYVTNNISKEKHGSYFDERGSKIRESLRVMREEDEITVRLAWMIASLEERLAGASAILDRLDGELGQGLSRRNYWKGHGGI